MARFHIGPVSFGGRRRVGFHGRVGPFGVSVGGRRKKGWGKFGGSGGSGGGSYYAYEDELTPEERLALAKRAQIQSYQTREVAFMVTSSRHVNRMAALLVATFVWDLGVWSLSAWGFTLLTLSGLRTYALGYLKKRDKKLSLLDGVEQSIYDENPESWYQTFKLTEGRRRVNALSLVALTANLAWAFATQPKLEVPNIIAGCVLVAWILARLFIFAGETGVGPMRFFVNLVRVVVSVLLLFILLLPVIWVGDSFGVIPGLIAFLVWPVVALVAIYFFWGATKTADEPESRTNSVAERAEDVPRTVSRWSSDQPIICEKCRTEFTVPKNARMGTTHRWQSFTPDDYCPNCGSQKHFHRERPTRDRAIGNSTPPRTESRSNEPRREPRVDLVLTPGDWVTHPAFGVGQVLAVEGEGEKAEVVVKFDSRGLRVLSVAWAPITKHA